MHGGLVEQHQGHVVPLIPALLSKIGMAPRCGEFIAKRFNPADHEFVRPKSSIQAAQNEISAIGPKLYTRATFVSHPSPGMVLHEFREIFLKLTPAKIDSTQFWS